MKLKRKKMKILVIEEEGIDTCADDEQYFQTLKESFLIK